MDIIYLLLPGILRLEQQFIPNLAAAANGGIVLEAEDSRRNFNRSLCRSDQFLRSRSSPAM
jgi:hypothetical protein